jgi:3-dehydroquinate dehydratase/shikimate dehydrogenase
VAARGFAFEQVGVQELVAYTAAGNARSRRLMERLGMRYQEGADFAHPGIADGHERQLHVLYRAP